MKVLGLKAPVSTVAQHYKGIPVPGFYFKVVLYQKGAEVGKLHCLKVDGIDVSLKLESKECQKTKKIKGLEYGEITIEKPVISHKHSLEKKLYKHIHKCVEDPSTPFYQLLLMALGHDHKPERSWLFQNVRPTKFQTSGFDSQSSGMLMDKITFSYESAITI